MGPAAGVEREQHPQCLDDGREAEGEEKTHDEGQQRREAEAQVEQPQRALPRAAMEKGRDHHQWNEAAERNSRWVLKTSVK